jgi:hypothetical protein
MSNHPARIDFDRAVQGHNGELIGEIGDRIEFMQVISQNSCASVGKSSARHSIDRRCAAAAART